MAKKFPEKQNKNQKIPVSLWLLIVLVLITFPFFIFFLIVYSFGLHISSSLYFLSGVLNLITGTWFIIVQARSIKNRFLNAKKVDELVDLDEQKSP